MTAEFKELMDKATKHELPSLKPDTAVVNSEAICLYQIATSMNEIDKTLKSILAEMKKRKV